MTEDIQSDFNSHYYLEEKYRANEIIATSETCFNPTGLKHISIAWGKM
jgi:hypothetical protein